MHPKQLHQKWQDRDMGNTQQKLTRQVGEGEHNNRKATNGQQTDKSVKGQGKGGLTRCPGRPETRTQ